MMSEWSSCENTQQITDAWRSYLTEGLLDNPFYSGLRAGMPAAAEEEEEEEEEPQEEEPPPAAEEPLDVAQALGDKPEVSFADAPTNRQQRRAQARGEKGSSKDTARTPAAIAKKRAAAKKKRKAQKKARRKNREHLEIEQENTELISESVINQWQKLAGITVREQ